jgi:acylglycerol lipase
MQQHPGTTNQETVEGVSGRIFFRSWRPDGKARGAIVIIPGFNAHSGYYEWVAEQFVASGLAVYALDLRGRGRSDGERFYVEPFEDYVRDVEAVMAIVKSRESGLPIFHAWSQRRRCRRLPVHPRPPG